MTEITEAPAAGPRLLRVADVAARLDIPVREAYFLVESGRLGAEAGLVRIGRRIRFDEIKLVAWLDRGGDRFADRPRRPGLVAPEQNRVVQARRRGRPAVHPGAPAPAARVRRPAEPAADDLLGATRTGGR